jgi:hypothetical protein
VAAGCRDGCSKELAATVDGMPFEESLKVTRTIKGIFTAAAVDGSGSDAPAAAAESAEQRLGAPPSPLAAFLAVHFSQAQLRTGFPLRFQAPWTSGADRSVAQAARAAVRLPAGDRGRVGGQTSGLAPGFTQANLVAVPKEHAFDFLSFALRNPRSCPLLAVTEPGDPCPRNVADAQADLRTDLPK